MILDDGPQNLLYLSTFVPKQQLIFLMRGQIGLSRRYLTRVGAIIVTNENLKTYAESVLPPIDKLPNIYIVPNALGEEFSRVQRREDKTDGIKKILFVGRFVPDKGVRELVEAFRPVHAKYPELQLRIVGRSAYTAESGEMPYSDYEREVMRIADKLPSNAISFAGHVPYEKIVSEYQNADLAVFPSVWVEGFGMTALEAMRCGLPVIVSDRPGFTSFVKHEVNGLVVHDPTDVNSLSATILRLVEEPQLATRLAQAALQVAAKYTPDAAVRAFIHAISAIAVTSRDYYGLTSRPLGRR